jgi:predicted Fe-Mo cluster-binding NifX family protein
MRIAIPYENGDIFQHFGQTKEFKLYDAEGGSILSTSILASGEHGHGALSGFLKQNRVDVLICGGIGPGAQQALAQEEIRLYGGVIGSTDHAAEDFLADQLQYNPDAACGHHDGHHHGHHDGHGHSCG